jgi:uncharacterized protein (DUF885 family)
MSAEFISRAERVVDALLESDPVAAMWAGDHRFDDRLPDLSADAVRDRVSMLRQASHALAEIDPDDLPIDHAVDLETLSNQVAARLFALTETRDLEWNPLEYNPGPLLNALLRRRSSPAAQRLEALTARLRDIPDLLTTARSNLSDVPRLHARTGAGQFRGAAALVLDELPGLLAQQPSLRTEVEPAAETAVTALRGFADWLEELPDGRDPRLGRRLWEAKLWHTLDTPLSAAKLLEQAWSRLDEITARIDETAARFLVESAVGGPTAASTSSTTRALELLAADRPGNETIVALANRTLAETTEFVARHDLVSLLDDPLEIVEMPEFARGVAAAYCDPPGALETSTVATCYAISPAPSHWDDQRVASFYAEYNDHMLHELTIHEAMPGHYLQLAHARRHRADTRVRALVESGTFVEGWAVYAEELMADHGYGGLPVRMQQLKMQLRMTINAIIDQLVHCENLPEQEAMELMTQRGHQSVAEAAGKWDRALLSSTQLSTYFVGHAEVAAIAADCPRGKPDKAWHDAMLAHGSPSPRHLRTLLGI